VFQLHVEFVVWIVLNDYFYQLNNAQVLHRVSQEILFLMILNVVERNGKYQYHQENYHLLLLPVVDAWEFVLCQQLTVESYLTVVSLLSFLH
jgi:hypothetical protein